MADNRSFIDKVKDFVSDIFVGEGILFNIVLFVIIAAVVLKLFLVF